MYHNRTRCGIADRNPPPAPRLSPTAQHMSHLAPAPASATPSRCSFCALRCSWHGRTRPFIERRTALRHGRSMRRRSGVESARRPAVRAATQQERLPPGETRQVGGGLWDRFFSLITGQSQSS